METNSKVIERTHIKTKEPKKYKVIMYNDDFTTMEFVVAILNIIFNKSFEEANKIMMEVHKRGKGIAGVYTYDIACLLYTSHSRGSAWPGSLIQRGW